MNKSSFLVGLGLPLAILVSSSGARAEPAPAPQVMAGYRLPEPEPPVVRRSYAWQVVLPTLAFDVLGIVGLSTKHPVMFIGYAGRSISGPIVHFAHRRQSRPALVSLALESLSPLLGMGTLFGYHAIKCADEGSDCYLSDAAVAVMVPLFGVAGTIVDAAWLANEPVKPEPPKGTEVSFAPYLAPQLLPGARKGEFGSAWTFGLVGRF
ncbi:hypothetical protein [Polyangium sp. 15x6]|uniref:hypothetical protein n=1 Tax=Polyangium sp. 15x6 TaxID=3042687 RepID=UPI00249B5E45|nr:hypothetical protein [Polyangium sp. 15x6]MDI3287364.1 hypothetical protein [Polyangium sp. 15x6]